MEEEQTVLVVGGTGRTGRRVTEQLLSRGCSVRAIVRSPEKLPAAVKAHAGLAIIEADLLSLGDKDLQRHVRGCDAVISCLGHVISLKGLFGKPRDLVTRATARLCEAIAATRPAAPVKYVLMSSVSVNRPDGRDVGRGTLDRATLWLLRGLVPPARDNQRASEHLHRVIGTANPFVQWVSVRPDTLREGDVSEYTVHENLVSSLFRPDDANMANVAHFMCELVCDPRVWERWQGQLPVIVNAAEEAPRG